MLIDKPGIARLIPHSGPMCLLDGVLSWSEADIRCISATHTAIDNPLRRDDRLGILCGVEYAAQAMALHVAFGSTQAAIGRPRVGYLASLRALACHADRLDLLPGTIVIEAERLHGLTDRAIYRFSLRHEDRDLIEGRAAIVLVQSSP